MRRGSIVRLISFGLFAVVIAPGCQTVHLREASINQAASYGDIQERQVLDNLAKFVYDINSLPSFAYSAQGTNQVQDQLSVGSTTTWQRIAAGIYSWMSSNVVPSAQRQFYQNWVLQPLNDPRKLDLMRCAYQQVVRSNLAARGLPENGACSPCDGGLCPDCTKRFNSFYTGSASTPTPAPGDLKNNGRITNLCLGNNPVWFAWGCKNDMPKHRGVFKIGQYRGMYVWVLPGGENELSKLTMAILDYAVNAPAEAAKPASKQVSFLVDANGKPTTQANAVGIVTGSVPANLPATSLLLADLIATKKKLESAKTRLGANDRKSVDRLTGEIEALDRLSEGLDPLPDQPGPYRPSVDESSAPNLLQFQLRLQSLQPLPTLQPGT